MRAFVTFLLLIPFVVAGFLAPFVCFAWLFFTGSWSPMLFIFLSGLIALCGLIFILFTSGFLGPAGIIGMPILYSAYIQFDFFTDYRAKFGDGYSIQFMLASMALASIPTAALGKGFETQPVIIAFRGMLSLSFVLSAYLLSNGTLSSYWHVLGLHAASIPIGFVIGYFVGDENEG